MSFNVYLEDKFEEKWTRDPHTKTKAQGLYAAFSSFEHIFAFSVFFNGLETLKPLVVKLQKGNQDKSFDIKQVLNEKNNPLKNPLMSSM